ncbi:carbohydrate-binding domain-containing protein [Gracilibacillus suaedae]|uniref:carbohydrate-binding domain-containing protein n=1 Tax=Gracilibacillus suaedae TaxID=2820273 RepID=UPI001ABEAFED|nr:carbohydrate-binding domain-containing protein [Gracilibacillus suaedae]
MHKSTGRFILPFLIRKERIKNRCQSSYKRQLIRSSHYVSKRALCAFLIVVAVLISGCSKSTENTSLIESAQAIVSYDTEDTYTDWDEGNVTNITFDNQSIDIEEDNNGVSLNDNTVRIHTSGTYVLEGNTTDNNIVIDAEDEGTVRLILNGVSLESKSTAPIFIKQADKTIISVEEGTSNTITDPSEYVYEEDTDEPKAAIYSKDDLTINGTGNLMVNGNYNDGITGKDDLKIIETTIDIIAKDDGIVGRDLFAMNDAQITIDAGGDGVKASNDTDEDKANIVLDKGSLTIEAGSDGIQSENTVTIVDGKYDIISGEGSPETIETTTEFDGGLAGQGAMPNGQGFSEENMPERLDFAEGEELPAQGDMGEFENSQPPEQMEESEQEQSNIETEYAEETVAEESTSTKGIKTENNLEIFGGTITIDANDDALHSNKEMTIAGGEINLATGDDAVHADEEITISDGSIQVDKSYEGIEAKAITISDGNIHVTAEDDGLNVNVGTDQMGMSASNSNQEDVEESTDTETNDGNLLIEGGYIYIDANGDGLDSNTSIEMTGGTVLVYGPTNNGNGALDYDQSFEIKGGTLIAAGSSGMAQGVSEDSAQSTFMMTYSEMLEADTTVYVKDSSGDTVVAVAPEKTFESILISSPVLQQDESYTIYTDSELSGDQTDGLYQDVTIDGGTEVLAFSLTSAMMYLNESGETEQTNGMFGGDRGQGQRQGGRGMQGPQ